MVEKFPILLKYITPQILYAQMKSNIKTQLDILKIKERDLRYFKKKKKTYTHTLFQKNNIIPQVDFSVKDNGS